MTGRGGWVATVLVLFVLAFFLAFTPVRIVRYFAALAILLVVASYVYTRILPHAITVSRVNETERGIKLQDIDLRLRVRNRSILPIPYFTIADAHGQLFTRSNSWLMSLGPFEERVVEYTVQGQSRGEFALGPVTTEGNGPFGMFAWGQQFEARGSVIVYPTIHPLDLMYNQGLPSGSLRINDKMYEDVTQFRSLREYVAGDDMKRINWKASAKTDKLFTMEFDSTLYFPVMVVLNLCRNDYPMRQRESLTERAAEVAASIPFFYAKLKQEIGFVSTGGIPGSTGYTTAPIKAGYGHAQRILELIAKLSPVDGHADFNEILYETGVSIPMGTKVIVVSPPFRQPQADVLIAAKRKGMNLLAFQIESQMERAEETHVSGAFPVVSVRRLEGETIHG